VALLLIAVAIGAAVSVVTCLTGDLLTLLRIAPLRLDLCVHLSGATGIDPIRLHGGADPGQPRLWLHRLGRAAPARRDVVDPIEANALYGGKMSLRDSVALAIMTLFCRGHRRLGRMEAAYTQSGSGLASQVGQWTRSAAMIPILVGCGAAAAISAAFNAPLAGSFYAFELVIGGYTLTRWRRSHGRGDGRRVGRSVFGLKALIDIPDQVPPGNVDFLYFIAIGVAAALVGVATMRAVHRHRIDPAAMEAAPRHPALHRRPVAGRARLCLPRGAGQQAMVRSRPRSSA